MPLHMHSPGEGAAAVDGEEPISRHRVEAGQRGDVFELKVSLEHGEDIDAVDSTGATAFFHATSNGHFAAMNLLRQRTLARSPPFVD